MKKSIQSRGVLKRAMQAVSIGAFASGCAEYSYPAEYGTIPDIIEVACDNGNTDKIIKGTVTIVHADECKVEEQEISCYKEGTKVTQPNQFPTAQCRIKTW